MALFVLLGVLRGFPAAAYRRTPHQKPLCGLDQNKNGSFLNWTPIVFILNSLVDTIQDYSKSSSMAFNNSGSSMGLVNVCCAPNILAKCK